jgi:DNA-binding CsgD family transcriptional regulator
MAPLDAPDELASRELEWVTALVSAERRRAAGEDEAEQWLAIRPLVSRRPTPYLEAYVLWRTTEAAGKTDRATAAGALQAGFEIAREVDAPALIAVFEALARRLRIDLDVPTQAGQPADPGATDDAPDPGALAPERPDPFGLTAREREILALLAEGYTNRRLAESLFISESTAGVHVSNILGKLGVSSRTEAATLAVRLGLDTAAAPDARPDDPQIRR